MKRRIIWNDIKENKLLAATTWFFMTLCAFMFAITCFLFVNLSGSIDTLMEVGKTPDFLQMHSGELSEEKLQLFAQTTEEVAEKQVLHFLNIDNSTIVLGGHSLENSTQDNGLCVQSQKFDYLVDLDNQIIEVADGEIYVPVCYRREYDLKAGDKAEIAGETFVIVGFLRDSQMNSMMSSSKRFLVSQRDYERMKESGSEEYLIEFMLQDGADYGQFETSYADAGLPANGPTITKPLIRMMNALSDGLMILVILLVSVLLLMISILCIRYVLLAQLEEARREIGMLKTIGIAKKEIRNLYFTKYLVLSVLGIITGMLFAILMKGTLSGQIQELYGTSGNESLEYLVAFIGVFLMEGIILLSIRQTCRFTEKLSAVEALTGQSKTGRKKDITRYVLVGSIIAAGIFMMVLPQNLLSTISSSDFVTHMGIGSGEIRIDIRQTDHISEESDKMKTILANDPQILRFVELRTISCKVRLSDGSEARLHVEQGDHTIFPVTYGEGRPPVAENEIALSSLCAEDLGMKVGDSLLLEEEANQWKYKITGIYSDITNGGKTAKAAWLPMEEPVMWSIFYVSLKESASKESWIANDLVQLTEKGIHAKTVDIQTYVNNTYGQTIGQVQKAAKMTKVAALLVIFVVVILFTRLQVARERNEISLRKAIGFTEKEIKKIYYYRYIPVVVFGIVAGILAGNVLGERLAGMMLKSLGATAFHFIVEYKVVFILIPVVTIMVIIGAVSLGLIEIKKIKPFECCVGKE